MRPGQEKALDFIGPRYPAARPQGAAAQGGRRTGVAQRLLDIAKVPLDMAGEVEGTARLTGTLRAPVADGSVALTKGRVQGQQVDRASAAFRWTRSTLYLDDALLEVDGSRIAMRGSVDQRGRLALDVSAKDFNLRGVTAFRTGAMRVEGAVDLTGKLDLPGLGGFVSCCTAFVANDSGPLHIARALGVPTLAIFGSTDPGMFDFAGHALLFAGVECAPCSFFGRSRCPRGHFRCMLDLTEERAWEALAPLLRAGRRLPLSA